MMFSCVAADDRVLIITARWASLHTWMLQVKILLSEATSNQGPNKGLNIIIRTLISKSKRNCL